MPRVRAKTPPNVVTDEDTLQQYVDKFLTFDAYSFDVETRGEDALNTVTNEVFWIAFAGPGASSFCVPLGHPVGDVLGESYKSKEPWYDHSNLTKRGKPRKKWRTITIPRVYSETPKQLWPDQAFSILKPLLFSDQMKVGWNIKFDLRSVAKYYDNEIPPGPYWDGEIAEHILDENQFSKSLKKITQKRFEFEYPELAKGGALEEEGFSDVARYALYDVIWTWLNYRDQSQLIEEQGLSKPMSLDMEVTEALVHAEVLGALADRNRLHALQDDLTQRMASLKGEIWKAAGWEINLNSNDQVAELVYEVRGHKPQNFTKTTHKPQTDKNALEPIAQQDPVVAKILEYNELSKIRGTYAEGLLKRIDSNDRVHTNYRLGVAATGRLSSREPNLQNIPNSRTELGRSVRSLFIAGEGHNLIVSDYSQIEPRVLAHFSKDEALTGIFLRGEDPYSGMASRVFGVDLESVKKEQRDQMKVLVLSLMYGVGDKNVAKQLGVNVRQAQSLIKMYHRTFPGAGRWMSQVIREARARRPVPGVETLLGRQRRLPELRFSDDYDRARAERQAVNSIIQGTAGEIMKIALVHLHKTLPSDIHLLLTVHDEVVVSAPSSKTDEAVRLVTEAMTGPHVQDLLSVPVTADAVVVSNWAEAK